MMVMMLGNLDELLGAGAGWGLRSAIIFYACTANLGLLLLLLLLLLLFKVLSLGLFIWIRTGLIAIGVHSSC